ncbi:MAG TPA: hypothetical protein PKH02_06250, partial [Bacteroidales bacterium]|nr:hypothetical protein [Bacteroidales bacterium]
MYARLTNVLPKFVLAVLPVAKSSMFRPKDIDELMSKIYRLPIPKLTPITYDGIESLYLSSTTVRSSRTVVLFR